MTVTLTPELLKDLRTKAEGGWEELGETLTCNMVLALLDRIQELEKRAEPLCGCGRTVTALGDRERDGCGKDVYFCRCEPLEAARSPVPIGRPLEEPIVMPARWACDTCGARQVYQGEVEPPLHECRPASRLRRLHNLHHSITWWVTPPKAESAAAGWCAKKAHRLHPLSPRKSLCPA